MSLLVRGSDLVGLPVVTLAGDDAAEVRDVLFDPGAGLLLGFTLNKRGFLAGRLKELLPRTSVVAVGPDAVMIEGPSAFVSEMPAEMSGGSGDVLGDRVLTDAGAAIGTVTDVVVDTADGRVVGYEIAPAEEGKGRHGRRSYIPLADAGTASGDTLIVPAAALDYMSSDLAGFGEAVDRFRALLHGDGPPVAS